MEFKKQAETSLKEPLGHNAVYRHGAKELQISAERQVMASRSQELQAMLLAKRTLRVVVFDDQPVVRFGLMELINAHSDIKVIGTAANSDEWLNWIATLNPDLVILDLDQTKIDGLTALANLRAQFPRQPILIYSATADVGRIKSAIDAGIQGYVLKNSPVDVLLQAVRCVGRGDYFIDPALGSALLNQSLTGPPQVALKAREIATLTLLAKGKRNKEIAAALHVSERTVKFYVSQLFDKLQVNNRTEAVSAAVRLGLIERDA